MGFSAVQFNTLLNWETTLPYRREPFHSTGGKVDIDRYDYEYFKYLDYLFDSNAEAGMLSVPVALWFNYLPGLKPGWYEPPFEWPAFTEEQAYRYGLLLGARYSAYPLVWLISADADFSDPGDTKFLAAAAKGIEAASFRKAPSSGHLSAAAAFYPRMLSQPWFDFHFLQSGHRRDGRGMPCGYVRAARRLKPPRPVVNGEMFFEHLGYTKVDERVSREVVRRAAWESFMAGANAGISYGNHGVWCWYQVYLVLSSRCL